jgi:iron complex transport system permease protein
MGALLSGCALAVSGAIIQSVLNNPLAGPNLIGINAGAGFFVLLSLVFLPGAYFLLQFFAFLGALVTTIIIMLIAIGGNVSRLTIILAGFAISSIFTAGMNTIMILYPDVYIGAGLFLVGGLAALTLSSISYPSIYISVGLICALLFSRDLNIISMGGDTAKSLGMNVKAMRFLLMGIAAVLAGAAVSFAGLMGFVGLVVPHAVRFLIGNDNRFVIPASAFLGATFVIICDLVARMAFRPYELPVGIIMSFIGGPFFIYLIIKHRRSNYD